MEARCQCGQLRADLPPRAPFVVACHCVACQRRTGSPFGVLAYYGAASVVVSGDATRYIRSTDEGNVFETYFCPTCGATVYARVGKHPELVGVPVGAIADPDFPAPGFSVWEETRHRWLSLDVERHFPWGIP